MTTNEASAASARWVTCAWASSPAAPAAAALAPMTEERARGSAPCPALPGSFHTSRKASPMFLLAAPPCRETSVCTMEAIELTNSMISSCSTSVVSVNWRMSQKPKMAMTLRPGTMGLRSPPDLMLSAITSAPASPKPTDRREQILVMECSRMRVSSCLPPAPALPAALATAWCASGFWLTLFTLFTMRSMGCRTSSSVSRMKRREAMERTASRKVTRPMSSIACMRTAHLTLTHDLDWKHRLEGPVSHSGVCSMGSK
jgi:hypothetical protein